MVTVARLTQGSLEAVHQVGSRYINFLCLLLSKTNPKKDPCRIHERGEMCPFTAFEIEVHSLLGPK